MALTESPNVDVSGIVERFQKIEYRKLDSINDRSEDWHKDGDIRVTFVCEIPPSRDQ